MLFDVETERRRDMIIVGLTGNIAAGKSTVSNFFKDLGAYVIDWDELARKVTRPHLPAWKETLDCFGKGILNDDLTINRQQLADIVFSDKEELAKLNRIVHPRVFQEDAIITGEIRSRDPAALVVKDIPLLFEVTPPIFVDKVIVVCASEQIQLRRLEEKGMTRKEAQRRIESQLPVEEKTKSADFVVNNDGPLEETKRQVEDIYSLLRKENRRGKRRVMGSFRGK